MLWTPSQDNSSLEEGEEEKVVSKERQFNLDGESIDMMGALRISLLPGVQSFMLGSDRNRSHPVPYYLAQI